MAWPRVGERHAAMAIDKLCDRWCSLHGNFAAHDWAGTARAPCHMASALNGIQPDWLPTKSVLRAHVRICHHTDGMKGVPQTEQLP